MNRYLTINLVFVLGLCALTASVAQAATIVLNASADASVSNFYGGGDTNNGEGGNLTVIPFDGAGKNSLVKFDFGSPPAGYAIDSAILTLTRNVDVNCLDATVSVWRAAKDWTEMGVTWNKYDGVNAWTNGGGDVVGTGGVQLTDAYGTATVLNSGAALGDLVNVDVTSLVREWYAGTYANNGILLTSTVPGVYPNEMYFGTKESGSPAILTVTLSQVPEPGTLAILAAGLLGLFCYAWKKRK